MTFPNDYKLELGSLNGSVSDSLQKEQEQFSISHDLVAARLLKRWFFPEELITAVQFHHQPQTAKKHHELPLVVALADIFSTLLFSQKDENDLPLDRIIANDSPELVAHWQAMQLPWNSDLLETVYDKLVQESSSSDSFTGIISSR